VNNLLGLKYLDIETNMFYVRKYVHISLLKPVKRGNENMILLILIFNLM